MYRYVCAYEYWYPYRSDMLGPLCLELQRIVSQSHIMLVAELKSCGGAVYALNCRAISLAPSFFLMF